MGTREWQVATLAQIPEPGAVEFRVGKGDWPLHGIVVRWQGQVYAYINSCAHLGHPLNLEADRFFTPDGTLLLCTSHGAVFEPDSGRCVGGPCAGASLRKLPCRVAGKRVCVTAPDTMRDI